MDHKVKIGKIEATGIFAALVIAALSAQGVSQVHDLRYIRRGYDGLERDLTALGAEIRIEP